MKKNKDFLPKEKLSSKKIFLLENILNNLSNNPKDKFISIPQEKSHESSKKRDFKTEIETRFLKAQNHKYIFPKRIIVAENDNDSSLESIKNLGVYDLNLQNLKKDMRQTKFSKKLMENLQRKSPDAKIVDFSETLQKMKQSLQEKLKKQLIDKKYNNFLIRNENEEIQNLQNNSHNVSDRLLENKSNHKSLNTKNTGRTSFSNLHSNFNRSLQQNAQNLDNFFKKKIIPLKENSKKMHLANFFEKRKEKQK